MPCPGLHTGPPSSTLHPPPITAVLPLPPPPTLSPLPYYPAPSLPPPLRPVLTPTLPLLPLLTICSPRTYPLPPSVPDLIVPSHPCPACFTPPTPPASLSAAGSPTGPCPMDPPAPTRSYLPPYTCPAYFFLHPCLLFSSSTLPSTVHYPLCHLLTPAAPPPCLVTLILPALVTLYPALPPPPYPSLPFSHCPTSSAPLSDLPCPCYLTYPAPRTGPPTAVPLMPPGPPSTGAPSNYHWPASALPHFSCAPTCTPPPPIPCHPPYMLPTPPPPSLLPLLPY